MLDCDKLHKNSSVDQLEYLHRYSMLTPEQEVIVDIIDNHLGDFELSELEEVIYDSDYNKERAKDMEEERDEICRLADSTIDSIRKKLENITNTLNEFQYRGVETYFNEIEDEIKALEREVNWR